MYRKLHDKIIASSGGAWELSPFFYSHKHHQSNDDDDDDDDDDQLTTNFYRTNNNHSSSVKKKKNNINNTVRTTMTTIPQQQQLSFLNNDRQQQLLPTTSTSGRHYIDDGDQDDIQYHSLFNKRLMQTRPCFRRIKGYSNDCTITPTTTVRPAQRKKFADKLKDLERNPIISSNENFKKTIKKFLDTYQTSVFVLIIVILLQVVLWNTLSSLSELLEIIIAGMTGFFDHPSLVSKGARYITVSALVKLAFIILLFKLLLDHYASSFVDDLTKDDEEEEKKKKRKREGSKKKKRKMNDENDENDQNEKRMKLKSPMLSSPTFFEQQKHTSSFDHNNNRLLQRNPFNYSHL